MITKRTMAIFSLASAQERENKIRDEANRIASKEARTNADRLEFEKSTKDRVDVSLKEYKQLKKDLEHYREEALSYKNALLKITKPLSRAIQNTEILLKIINGKFDCEVVTSEDQIARKFIVRIAYNIDESELLER